MMEALIRFARDRRIPATRIVALALLSLILVTDHSWERYGLLDLVIEFSGFVLIGICTFGRLWSSLYISGFKERRVVTEGPYSMVRHPLYFFSFLGAIGIGLAAENILVLAVLVLLFVFYYPFVILGEEKKLIDLHGEDYLKYMETTPRFLPKLSLLSEPELYPVDSRRYRSAFFDAMWFFWFFMILQIVERLRFLGWLPVLFRVP